MADDKSDHEDEFEDASETIPELPPMDLVTSVRAAKTCLDMFLDNRFQEGKDFLRPWVHESMYHALGYSALHFIQALMTYDPHDVELAVQLLQDASEVCSKKRKKNTISNNTVTKIVKRPNYNSYTEEEVHAELIYAELLLLRALATFVQDESLISFIKGGLRIRSCYMTYKDCYDILTHRKWNNAELKMNFEAGVFLGIGTFNLVISALPGKILRLLEFIGFSGNKDIALSKLDQGRKMQDSIRGPLCSLCLLIFNTVITFAFGNGKINLEYCKSILEPLYEAHPKGTVIQFFKARVEVIQGYIPKAVDCLNYSVDSQTEWRQFKFLCFWELAWCHFFLGNWRKSAYYINILKNESHWSKSIPCYMHACAMLMCNDLTEEEYDNILEYIKVTPSLRRRFAGKSVPMEKFFCKRALRFIAQDNWLFLPALENVYTWNYFIIVGKNLECTNRILGIIERAIADLPKSNSVPQRAYLYTDNYCLGVFLRGVCLRYMNSPLLAEECFREVIQNEKNIKEDAHLVPWSLVELGYMYLDLGKPTQAQQFLEAAKNNYKGYSLESRLHFKVHAALNEIKVGQSVVNFNGSGLSQPASLEFPMSSPESLPNLTATTVKNGSDFTYIGSPDNGPVSLPVTINSKNSTGMPMEGQSIHL